PSTGLRCICRHALSPTVGMGRKISNPTTVAARLIYHADLPRRIDLRQLAATEPQNQQLHVASQ
ncbi:MAG: hypothetical protein ACJA0V_004537, partial [Planctomycetota bacterium]